MMPLSSRSSCGLLCSGLLSAICLAPAARVAAQAVNLEPVGVIAEPADVVRVNGSFAYVAAGPRFTVFDIANPASPTRKGSLTFPDTIYGMSIVGSVAYLANGLRGLAIVDLANADAPSVIGSIKTPGEALRVVLTGTKALVVNRLSGVEVIDVSNPARPVSVGSHYTDGYARDIAVAGAVAYVVDSTNDLALLDVSKAPPTELSRQGAGLTTAIVAVSQPAATSGNGTAYVVGGGALQVYDVSNPAAARRVASPKIAEQAQAAVFHGSLGYIAAGANGLQVVDVSDPKAPRIVGSYKTPGVARDVAVASPLVLVAVAGPKGSSAASTSPAGVYILRQR